MARIEMRHGYNIREKKYYVQLIDVDTQDNMKVYLDAEDFRDFAETMIDNVKVRESEKK